jgi:hypothetical protein
MSTETDRGATAEPRPARAPLGGAALVLAVAISTILGRRRGA